MFTTDTLYAMEEPITFLEVMERLQFMGRSHNSKSYERILIKFSSNVQKGSRNKCLYFGGDGKLIYLFVSVCLLAR